MARTLPDTPGLISVVPRLVTLRNELRSGIGGNLQRIQRKGDHYALDVVVEPMDTDQAAKWNDIRNVSDTILMDVPQPNYNPGPVGLPKVKGAGQSGTNLIVDGITPGIIIRKGRYLSVVTSGERFLYCCDSTVIVDAAGEATIPLETMLITPHADNDVVELSRPKIEGFPTAKEDTFKVDGHWLVYLEFTVEERG